MKNVWFVIFLCSALPVHALSFGNGDFSNSGQFWNDASVTGSLGFSGGQAVLSTGDGTDEASAVLVQGDDGSFWFPQTVDPFTLNIDTEWLYFDAMFEDFGVDATETGGSFFSDSLFVSLYDYLDTGLDLLLDPSIDVSSDGAGFKSYKFDVSSLQGRDIALSFELADENDGVNSKVTLDNVRFSAAVPAPSALILLLAGLPLIRRILKKT